jgi:hypothetical protein
MLRVPLGFHSPRLAVAELASIGATLAIYRFARRRLDRWARGVAGETSIGQVLDELKTEGWRALHSVQTGKADIDHVVVGPGASSPSRPRAAAEPSAPRGFRGDCASRLRHIDGVCTTPSQPLT